MKILTDKQKKAIDLLTKSLKKVEWYVKIQGQKITKFPAARRGNKVYAFLMQQRLDPVIKLLTQENDAKFITLTLPYDYDTPEKSWKEFREKLPRLVRKAKFKAYFYVYEAHERGGCHVHLIARGGPDLAKLKAIWPGHIKVKKVESKEVGAYLTKEIGKAGHVETALKNVKAGQATAKDWKKIWRLYYLTTLKMRGWGTSRNLKVEDPNDEELPNDLIKDINNSTDDETNEEVRIFILPKSIVWNELFEPYTGPVLPDTPEFLIINNYLERLNEFIRPSL